jgi:hypothetical protein
MARFSGALYQLSSRQRLTAGAYVAVNGPFDQFGVIMRCTLREDGLFDHLIRGVQRRPHETPVASF